MTPFDLQYRATLKRILEDGSDQENPWSGRTPRALPGVTIQVDTEECFPVLTLRKVPLKMFIAEQIWFLMGEKDPTWVNQFTPIWKNFVEDDGTIETAYGYRWRHHFGRDQITSLLQHLKENPHSRHGVVVTWDPSQDGLGPDKRKNIPCPYTFTVNIIGGRLHLHNIVRSNDMFLGNPSDVAGFALLQHILAQKLGVRPGIYTHSISNAHIYDNHFPQVRELLSRNNDHPPIRLTLPENAYDRAVAGDVDLVKEILHDLKKQYEPMSALKGDITVNVY